MATRLAKEVKASPSVAPEATSEESKTSSARRVKEQFKEMTKEVEYVPQ